MTDEVCYVYTQAFLQYLRAQGDLTSGQEVAIAGDFRSSTPRIMGAAAMAIQDLGFKPVNCGFIPTPALALYGISHSIPSIMVTGSHIPDDRNGIKFNKPSGEILKQDESAIRTQTVTIPAAHFSADGMLHTPQPLPPEDLTAYQVFVQRYLKFFPPDALQGLRIGLYEHSSVARQALGEILEKLGADVTRLNRSQAFVPVDTEAIRQEDVDLAHEWARTYKFDCIISTDGDGDRPLVSDEKGNWLRGDLLGILCARYLGAEWVVTPVSSNSALEKSGWFNGIDRTRIGSPYVIAAMNAALAKNISNVVGYEANGGFLIAADITQQGRTLPALPTRDAVIVPLAVLMLAAKSGTTLSRLVTQLPQRYTHSNRLKHFPTALSQSKITALSNGDFKQNAAATEALFAEQFGPVQNLDSTDGLRITFKNEEVVHLRPSGNAPELRCYNEANSPERASEMNHICISLLEEWRTT